MTRKKRYLFSYLLLALALVVLFAANLFWASSPSCACPGP